MNLAFEGGLDGGHLPSWDGDALGVEQRVTLEEKFHQLSCIISTLFLNVGQMLQQSNIG